jgi:hypothetical protein
MNNTNPLIKNLMASIGWRGKLTCVIHVLDDDLVTKLPFARSISFLGFGFGGLPLTFLIAVLRRSAKIKVTKKVADFAQVQWDLSINGKKFLLDSDDWGDCSLHSLDNERDLLEIIEILKNDRRFELK